MSPFPILPGDLCLRSSPAAGRCASSPSGELQCPGAASSERISIEFDLFRLRFGEAHGNDVKTVRVAAEIIAGDELLGSPAQTLLFLLIYKVGRIAVLMRRSGLRLDEHKYISIQGHQVELPKTPAPATRQDVIPPSHQETTRHPFPAPTFTQMIRQHRGNVCRPPVSSQERFLFQRTPSRVSSN
jgi:hypothetical protein